MGAGLGDPEVCAGLRGRRREDDAAEAGVLCDLSEGRRVRRCTRFTVTDGRHAWKRARWGHKGRSEERDRTEKAGGEKVRRGEGWDTHVKKRRVPHRRELGVERAQAGRGDERQDQGARGWRGAEPECDVDRFLRREGVSDELRQTQKTADR